MTKQADGFRMDVDWLDDCRWEPECQHCHFFEHTYCDNSQSEHHGLKKI